MSEIKYLAKSKVAGVNDVSRYRKLRRILENDEQYIETYEHLPVEKTATDVYHIVTLADVNRLDLIAYQYYGNPQMWWVIAEASEITDPFDIPIGTVVRIPQKTTLYKYTGVLSR